MEYEHIDLLREKSTYLVENVNPTGSGLNTLLFQEKVIDQEEREYIEYGEGAVRQTERLLSVLRRKSKKRFEQFLVVLVQTGQSHVANELNRTLSDDAAAENTTTLKDSISASRTTTSIRNLTHVIAANEDREGGVTGLTVCGNELFIVRSKSKGLIEVYDLTNFTFKRNIEVKELDGRFSRVNGMASCESNSCLYVGYWDFVGGGGVGYIVRVKRNGKNKVVKWKVLDGYSPLGLSVNSEHHLVVACSERPRLIVYSTNGVLIHEVRLPDDIMYPRHAIQLDNGQFLISRDGVDMLSIHEVCVIDANGIVVLSYGSIGGYNTGELHEPRHLAIDKNGFIFVADLNNNRIVVLDSTLKWSRDLKIDDGGDGFGVRRPYSLHLEDQRNLLFIGEYAGNDSRLLVVKV